MSETTILSASIMQITDQEDIFGRGSGFYFTTTKVEDDEEVIPENWVGPYETEEIATEALMNVIRESAAEIVRHALGLES